MATPEKTKIRVSNLINARIEKVWDLWTMPRHIIHWNHASDTWLTSYAENDLREGGKFLSHMEARNGSVGFDFTGGYNKVIQYQSIIITLGDGRKLSVTFTEKGKQTEVVEIFEAEEINTIELQKNGWQCILDNFKKYVETTDKFEILHFEININSPVEKVFEKMLRDETFRDWTSIFNPTSHYKGSWEKGSKIIFLGTATDGSQGGMVSRIRENIPSRFVSIEHLGIVKNGMEIKTGKEVDGWKGLLENYNFRSVKEGTKISVEIDSTREFKSYFLDTWPKALERLKSICE